MNDRIAVPLPLFDRLVQVSRQLSDGNLEMADWLEPSAYFVPTVDLLEMKSIIDLLLEGE